MRRGVIYPVTGERYAAAAELSAKSLSRVSPEIEITMLAGHGPDGYRDKIVAAQQSPFDQTLVLDCDTYVVRPVEPIFELLARFDIAAAHAPHRINLALDEVSDAFPEFNTGVIGLRRSDETARFLDDWLAEYDRLAFHRRTWDQPSFRRAVYRSSLRVATLPPEWNQRFTMSGYQNQTVRILHGWFWWRDEPEYEAVACQGRSKTDPRRAG